MGGNLMVLQPAARANIARAMTPATLPPRSNRAIVPAAVVDLGK